MKSLHLLARESEGFPVSNLQPIQCFACGCGYPRVLLSYNWEISFKTKEIGRLKWTDGHTPKCWVPPSY